jgi:hypothetical protein
MALRGATRSSLLLLGAAALAGCSDGGSDAGVAVLRAKVEAQAGEIEALKRSAKEMDARARLLEERLSAAKPAPAATVAPAPAEAPVAGEETTGAVAAFLETEQGRQKLVEAMEAAEKRRAAQTEKEQRDRMLSIVKERVTGYLTEQLNLDTAQQQTVLAVAADATERTMEVWRGMRENRGDAAAFTQAREKSNEIRQEAVDKIQQALTVDQFNRFQEILNEGGGGLFLGGGRGGFSGGGAGATPAGGSQGGGRGGR